MALKLRLTRMGSKKKPFYRVVVMEAQSRRDGRALAYVGYYNPMTDPADVKLDLDAIKTWMERGAQPTDTVRSLLKRAGVAA
ncbi:MAG: ribosomal protein [Desulfomicrobiaceae bacterium]|jgi:small subunit ribosomal protein S16|nr:30S ribosomal protein S16 [Desulfomicrobiaceae bacterium]MBZ4648942.1 ribosomal protein [Desulfomicrobiaceae bacterium]MBZ4686146.1 ribosomal protein [Desulfomicrobiaceae bacterium]MDI3492681.1 small subunit ribosomal protein [Desulfomicrobiaceae bacterium]MDK2873318.1 small subunit ribosomal protein [Desulfomicrobiaceae bacterium]